MATTTIERRVWHRPPAPKHLGNPMPLDHYVSQVHLRNFCSPVLDGRLHAVRKSDLKYFQPRTQDVCRIEDGNTNPFLKDQRAIEEFLKSVEPNYNKSVDKLRCGKIDKESIYAIAGFVAYIATCTPASMRIWSTPWRLMAEGAVLAGNSLPKAPDGKKPDDIALTIEPKLSEYAAEDQLDDKSFRELLEEGAISYDIDRKIPQAAGIEAINLRLSRFGNSRWEVLHNDQQHNPFFTSDNPLALDETDSGVTEVGRVVPLTPNLALRVVTDETQTKKIDLSFSKLTSVHRKLSRKDVVDLNRLIARCAEDCVFYRDDHDWVRAFIAKHRNYRINPVTRAILRDGYMEFSMKQRVRPNPVTKNVTTVFE
jgi:Protein of unknown function (DUF4238)